MRKTDAEYYDKLNGCVAIHEITWDWLKEEGSDEWKMVCTTCNIDDDIFKDYVVNSDYGCWYKSVPQDEWEAKSTYMISLMRVVHIRNFIIRISQKN